MMKIKKNEGLSAKCEEKTATLQWPFLVAGVEGVSIGMYKGGGKHCFTNNNSIFIGVAVFINSIISCFKFDVVCCQHNTSNMLTYFNNKIMIEKKECRVDIDSER